VALVPLLIAILNVSPRKAFVLSWVSGVISFALIFHWVFQVSGYKIIHHFVLALYFAPFFGAFGLAISFIKKRYGCTAAISLAPFLWVSMEYIRSNIGFMAFPYAWLGYTQHEYPLVIQIASVAGTYGVSFLLAMVNSAVAALVLNLRYRSKNLSLRPIGPISKRGLFLLSATAAFLTIMTISYGAIVLSRPTIGEKLRVSVVQGNIEQAKKWDRRYRSYILETYEKLSKEASKDQPELIVWPEAATPGFVLKDLTLLQRITGLVRETNAYFLIGSCEYPKFERSPSQIGQFGNTALFFSPNGKVLGQYLKIHLVPFVEYVPYQKLIPWPRFIVPDRTKGYEVPGNKITLFDLQGTKFGTVICWEVIFPKLTRDFVKDGAQFLLNITNEAWFGRSVGPQHYLISSIFRAVENRVYVVRCANTGISCFIDPYGRVLARIKDANNQDLLVRGVLTQTCSRFRTKSS